MKLSKNFSDYEFVPPEIYQQYGRRSRWFIDPTMVHVAQFIREWFDAPTTINDWKWGGDLKSRGYRTPETMVGSKYSQHKLANAIDISVSGLTADEVRLEILNNQDAFMDLGITTIEHPAYSPTWVHLDKRNTTKDYILIVKPVNIGTLAFDKEEEYYKWEGGKYVQL